MTGGFWYDLQRLNAAAIIPHCLTWVESAGWLSNFDRAADGTLGGEHAGIEFVDSEVYKLLEAMAWEIGSRGDSELAETYHSLVRRVAAAQEHDGYLHTSFGRPGQPARFSNLEWGHELYCFGHLLQAAVARLRTGYDDQLPAVGRRLANFLVVEFGDDGRKAIGGHPEIEVALAEFGRATGTEAYIDLAATLVERRGHGLLKPIEYGQDYFQDDRPVRSGHVLTGHAVRALYLAAGALDVGQERGDEELILAVESQYAATLARRTYITGAMGSHHRDEAFGEDFELPHDRAYAETCAAIGSVMVSWRLLLKSGAARYGDVMERTLFNAVLASPRADGRAFFYSNTLHQRAPGVPPHEDVTSPRAQSSMRAPWFDVSCCPTNVARTLASAHLYFVTRTGTGMQIHQFANLSARCELDDGVLAVQVDTAYPYEGRVTVTVAAAPPTPIELALRIPAWAQDGAAWSTDNPGLVAEIEGGYVRLRGVANPGDRVTLDLPVTPRVVRPDPRIDDVRGQVAIERGPLVLALESVDLPSGADTESVEVDLGVPVELTPTGARVALRRRRDGDEPWPYSESAATASGHDETFVADLIPYRDWANRGPSTMRIFMPVTSE
ncbi:glycoside hydrolase family 127 protein [Demequina sp. TTPB684]|nr:MULTISPECIES: beta-L-arabinofuranosidase domain-containing protein [unclassified Demequina]MCB2413721.1 glycoside hydrolase family 127 protein [Demequina sp. TTPB684]UPU89710.1 glycoside hydrolase family 127 protein [Demequina sp. TMPB413]